jgi:hypothetical protein
VDASPDSVSIRNVCCAALVVAAAALECRRKNARHRRQDNAAEKQHRDYCLLFARSREVLLAEQNQVRVAL